jgi:hypothetical protein
MTNCVDDQRLQSGDYFFEVLFFEAIANSYILPIIASLEENKTRFVTWNKNSSFHTGLILKYRV